MLLRAWGGARLFCVYFRKNPEEFYRLEAVANRILFMLYSI